MPPKLHFAYAATAPSLEPFDVKTVRPDELAGSPGAFAVIGESHYVGVPALDFHEVCSCEPLSGERVRTVALDSGVERTFAFESDRLDARTRAVVRPLDAFPGADSADVAYRFGADAWTTIRIRDAAYETYHTYPEYDLALYTDTRLAPRSADADSTSASAERGSGTTDADPDLSTDVDPDPSTDNSSTDDPSTDDPSTDDSITGTQTHD